MAKGIQALIVRTHYVTYPKEASSQASMEIETDTWIAFISRQTQVSIYSCSLDKELLYAS
jgi:hypothetical protein